MSEKLLKQIKEEVSKSNSILKKISKDIENYVEFRKAQKK